MVLQDLREKQINLPFIGGISILAAGGIALAIILLTRRKKSVRLQF